MARDFFVWKRRDSNPSSRSDSPTRSPDLRSHVSSIQHKSALSKWEMCRRRFCGGKWGFRVDKVYKDMV